MNQALHPKKISKARFFQAITQKSDAIISGAMIGFFLNGLFLSFFYDTWLISLGVGCLCLLGFYSCKYLLPHSALHQYVASSVFAIFMAQFIYQMHGMFEMHFWAFVAATLLITYQNWKLYIPLSLIIVVHHAGLAYLQYSGMQGVYFTQLSYMDMQTFAFHAALAVLIIGICGYWSYDLSRRTIADGLNQLLLEEQLSNVEKNIAFAEEISKGNLSLEHTLGEQQDELSKALINMRQSLLEASLREQHERFVNTGVARIGEILRNNINNLEELTDRVLKEIVTYLQLNQGGLFLVEEDEKDHKFLSLNACFAYNRKKYLQRSIEIGEGLVGQAYLEKDVLYLTDVPQGYTTITSGLGHATASSILIVPLVNNDEIIGILEVASLQVIPENHINFLKKASESIASTLLSARVNAKTKKLLEQAQYQAEAIQAQEEEMRQHLEELEATQEEVIRRTRSYEEQLTEKDEAIAQLREQLKQLELRSAVPYADHFSARKLEKMAD
ncbi:GAF domain-containing protein [Cesiribacter andamanensis]|uniref:Putative periplasmic ligand-binding sensor domain protein n=1 Tax=Cesiribacter andamanensis AMV16 TaxID=1279009 RepID=M7NR74_9BACT|nr:GAF domain-containing protein [Cesiribacter andamanensis]EMR01014.1 putative periplasmic ligand-binding sensor domain protein [Cesiribacter andamanensis AMV16]